MLAAYGGFYIGMWKHEMDTRQRGIEAEAAIQEDIRQLRVGLDQKDRVIAQSQARSQQLNAELLAAREEIEGLRRSLDQMRDRLLSGAAPAAPVATSEAQPTIAAVPTAAPVATVAPTPAPQGSTIQIVPSGDTLQRRAQPTPEGDGPTIKIEGLGQ